MVNINEITIILHNTTRPRQNHSHFADAIIVFFILH